MQVVQSAMRSGRQPIVLHHRERMELPADLLKLNQSPVEPRPHRSNRSLRNSLHVPTKPLEPSTVLPRRHLRHKLLLPISILTASKPTSPARSTISQYKSDRSLIDAAPSVYGHHTKHGILTPTENSEVVSPNFQSCTPACIHTCLKVWCNISMSENIAF